MLFDKTIADYCFFLFKSKMGFFLFVLHARVVSDKGALFRKRKNNMREKKTHLIQVNDCN